MADDFPDVLDHLGKTPREFGAVHVHVEPVVRDLDDRAMATVWCQAAAAEVTQCKRKCNSRCHGARNKSKCVGECRRSCDR